MSWIGPRPRIRTPEADAAIDEEAMRRAKKLPPSQRVCTKIIAETFGLSVTYTEVTIARRRREIESQIDVNLRMSGAVCASPQSSNA